MFINAIDTHCHLNYGPKESLAHNYLTDIMQEGDFYTAMDAAREFYAVYTNTIRKYNVYFYNDDELLYTAENIPYGSSTSYIGATPTKLGVENPDEYVFKGWVPLPENITGEIIKPSSVAVLNGSIAVSDMNTGYVYYSDPYILSNDTRKMLKKDEDGK